VLYGKKYASLIDGRREDGHKNPPVHETATTRSAREYLFAICITARRKRGGERGGREEGKSSKQEEKMKEEEEEEEAEDAAAGEDGYKGEEGGGGPRSDVGATAAL